MGRFKFASSSVRNGWNRLDSDIAFKIKLNKSSLVT